MPFFPQNCFLGKKYSKNICFLLLFSFCLNYSQFFLLNSYALLTKHFDLELLLSAPFVLESVVCIDDRKSDAMGI